MKNTKVLFAGLLCSALLSCNGTTPLEKGRFQIITQPDTRSFTEGDSFTVSLRSAKDMKYDSVVYFLNNSRITNPDNPVRPSSDRLGSHLLRAVIYREQEKHQVQKEVVITAKEAPEVYTYEVVNVFPHDITSYTQGLEFHKDTLYESTGQRGKSVLRKLDFATGKVYQEFKLEDRYFGEGITVFGDSLYMLTWQSNTGFIHHPETLERIGSFTYQQSREGWGLTHDENTLFKSDGTDKIWKLDPVTLKENGFIQTVTDKAILNKSNELEYVDGKIYANVYLKDGIMIIDARSGQITGVADLRGLKNEVTQHPALDVLNGIAYHPDRKTFFVTGKNWDKLFEIRFVPKQD